MNTATKITITCIVIAVVMWFIDAAIENSGTRTPEWFKHIGDLVILTGLVNFLAASIQFIRLL